MSTKFTLYAVLLGSLKRPNKREVCDLCQKQIGSWKWKNFQFCEACLRKDINEVLSTLVYERNRLEGIIDELGYRIRGYEV